MLRVDQLILYTKAFHKKILANAGRVSVKILKVSKGKDKDKDKDDFRKIEAVCRGDTIPRYVTLMFWGPYSTKAMVWVSCTCEYFKYTNEVALEHQGSSDIKHSNGNLPRETNPGLTPSTCKHVLGCILANAHLLKPN